MLVKENLIFIGGEESFDILVGLKPKIMASRWGKISTKVE